MTKRELLNIGYNFMVEYLPDTDVFISVNYLDDISPVYYENVADALKELEAVVKNFTELAEKTVIINKLNYYYFKENFTLTEFQYKTVFELGRFLWYISIDYNEFITEVQDILEKYL